MIDVARLAGVSHQTVSRVLNASPAVGPELTLRVQEAIRHLGYKRNPAARALASRRSMNLGVITFGISLYGPSLTLFGIAEAARQVGYTTSLITLADVTRETVRNALDHLEDVSADGVVIVAPVNNVVDMIQGMDIQLPMVTFEPGAVGKSTSVAVDEVLGARMATRHLLELGHQSVWHVAGPGGWLGADARIKGWRQELAANRRIAHELIEGEDWSVSAGYKAGKRVAADREITSVFVANDQMSLGLLRALHEAGLRVPEDISVVGFDDIPESAFFLPPLTTVRLDFDRVGRACVDIMMDMLRGRNPLGVATIPPPELVVRASSAAPRST